MGAPDRFQRMMHVENLATLSRGFYFKLPKEIDQEDLCFVGSRAIQNP